MRRASRQAATIPARTAGAFINRTLALVALVLPTLAVTAPVVAGDDEPRARQSLSDEQVRELVRSLGDPSYKSRVDATRRLCAIGPRATAALKRAREGKEPEIALRAGKLLEAFEQLLFSGMEITLRISKKRITWDEPVDLIVTMANRSAYDSLVPVTLPIDGANSPDNEHARQVAGMIDLGDWLLVRAPGGKEVSLHADDIDAEPAVADVVRQRLEEAPIGTLPPGESVTLTLPAFNRGWARFRMLDKGRYSVRLVYVPQWEDDQLLTNRVGAVESNVATVDVTSTAPSTVSRRGRERSLTVSIRGTDVRASLTNHLDRAVHINTHFGTGVPFAKGVWIAMSGDTRREVSVHADLPSLWQQFDSALIVKVPPGGTIVLAETPWTDLRQRLTEAGADFGTGHWTLQFSYGNLLDRKWQRRHPAEQSGGNQLPPGLRDPLPLWMPVTRLTSEAVAVRASD